jgi:hypothetical protein
MSKRKPIAATTQIVHLTPLEMRNEEEPEAGIEFSSVSQRAAAANG